MKRNVQGMPAFVQDRAREKYQQDQAGEEKHGSKRRQPLSRMFAEQQPVSQQQDQGKGDKIPQASLESAADYLGLTLETVSRQISRLKVEKIISLEGNRTISVLDMRRLMATMEQERD